MKILSATIFFLGLSASLCIGEASARQPSRTGLWAEAGLGTGVALYNCSACSQPIQAFGESTYIRGGGTFSEKVLWGVEFFSLLSDTFKPGVAEGVLELEVISIAPVILWFPWRNELFFKAGVGLSRGEIRTPETETNPKIEARGIGSGMTFGMGVDVPVRSWLALTVNIGAYIGAIGDLEVEDTFIDDIVSTVFNVNIGLTLR